MPTCAIWPPVQYGHLCRYHSRGTCEVERSSGGVARAHKFACTHAPTHPHTRARRMHCDRNAHVYAHFYAHIYAHVHPNVCPHVHLYVDANVCAQITHTHVYARAHATMRSLCAYSMVAWLVCSHASMCAHRKHVSEVADHRTQCAHMLARSRTCTDDAKKGAGTKGMP